MLEILLADAVEEFAQNPVLHEVAAIALAQSHVTSPSRYGLAVLVRCSNLDQWGYS